MKAVLPSMSTVKDAKRRVLIVEDEKPLAKALSLKLEGLGITSDIVHDGDAALETLARNNYDLIVLDLILPKRDGFGVMEELKIRGNTTPVIVASNLGQDEDLTRATALGAKAYFVKSDTQIAYVAEQVKKLLEL